MTSSEVNEYIFFSHTPFCYANGRAIDDARKITAFNVPSVTNA